MSLSDLTRQSINMLKFTQQTDFALGDSQKISELSEKSSAKILVVSDSHGKPWIFKSILYQFGKKVDALFFCGDGMPDLISILEESYLDSELAENIPDVLYFVHGNGDNSTIQLVTNERILLQVPREITATVSGKKIFMTHGHSYNVYFGTKDLVAAGKAKNADLIFYGHTHLASVQKKKSDEKEMMVLNPGSCSFPRGGMPNSCAVVTIAHEKAKADFFEIQFDDDGNILFKPFNAPTHEMKFF